MHPLTLLAQTSNDIYAVDTSSLAGGAVVMVMILFILGFLLITYALIAYLLSRIFKKAGVEGWRAWIPLYSTWVTLELGGQRGWWSLFFIAPLFVQLLPLSQGVETAHLLLYILAVIGSLVATVFLYMAMYKIGLHLGKEGYFVLWAIFLPLVWYIWLAFDASTWKESVVHATNLSPATKKGDHHSPSASV